MNALIQQENGLIGSEKDIAALAEKAKARLLVISDSHGEYEVFQKIVEDFGPDSDALVFCGDGACDILELMKEARNDEKLRAVIPPVIAFVRGNGDAPLYRVPFDAEEDVRAAEDPSLPPVLKQLSVPDRIVFSAAGRSIFVVHGHHHNVDWGVDTLSMLAGTNDADLIFYGHTHRPYQEEAGGSLILNPGSCSRPRGSPFPSFASVAFPGSTERFETEYFTMDRNIFGLMTFTPFSI
ncbi:MAG: YfcE family phosphodiesterase [Treponema sp.]|nr:YfcE family phosphodiesterase [Candidatus Treponema caballi]